jgi:hypothetical protein
MFTAIVCALLFYPIVIGSLRLAARLLGWTLRMVMGIVLFPVWLVLIVFGGIFVAFQALLPFALIALLISMFVPEQY